MKIFRVFRLFSIGAVLISVLSLTSLSVLTNNAYAGDTSLLTNLNNPNVLIFLDTSGSMMWNEGVKWKNSTASGYDAPESWSGGKAQGVPWAPGSNSIFSKIYNAKMALSQIVTDPSFSNLNFAFASFDQTDTNATPAANANQCMYANDESFQNQADALYYPYAGSTGTGTPDETGEYYTTPPTKTTQGVLNPNYPFSVGNCSGSGNLTGQYFISYDYRQYISNNYCTAINNGTCIAGEVEDTPPPVFMGFVCSFID